MHTQTKKLRDTVKHIPGSWVRRWKDGEVWAGTHQTIGHAGYLREMEVALESAGFQCKRDGRIIDVTLTQ